MKREEKNVDHLSERMKELAMLFGDADSVPLQIILQKITLNKRRDDRENASCLREMALSSP